MNIANTEHLQTVGSLWLYDALCMAMLDYQPVPLVDIPSHKSFPPYISSEVAVQILYFLEVDRSQKLPWLDLKQNFCGAKWKMSFRVEKKLG